MPELTDLAVEDNAAWCRFVSTELNQVPVREAHGGMLFQSKVPEFYPNFVSTDSEVARCNTRALVEALRALQLPPGFGVKDSYANLDLEGFGFRCAIEAQWIALEMNRSAPGFHAPDLTTQWVTTPNELDVWLRAAALSCFDGRQFFSHARASSVVSVLSVMRDTHVVAGAIFTTLTQAIGVSNVFTAHPDIPIWSIIHQEGQQRFGARTLVGWESGDVLDAACNASFTRLHPLSVWISIGELR